MNRLGYWMSVSALAAVIGATAISAQEVAAGGPAIASVEVRVRDLGTQEELEPLLPGGRLTLEEGQRVRLRMTAIPRAQNRGPRFPSARFALVGNTRKLQVERVNEQLGSMVLRARSPDLGRGASFVTFEVLEPLAMNDRMRAGRISIEIAPNQPPAPPRDSPRVPDARLGATFYEHADFRGRSSRFTE